ncbi:MAG: FG-GAP repeat domain-containing protein [Bradymonadia bacterium]
MKLIAGAVVALGLAGCQGDKSSDVKPDPSTQSQAKASAAQETSKKGAAQADTAKTGTAKTGTAKDTAKTTQATSPTTPIAAQKPVTASSGSTAGGAWPPCDRVFVAQLTEGIDHVLGAQGSRLWARTPGKSGQGEPLWAVDGQGVVQKVVVGDFGQGRKLYVARGIGRGHLGAPITLEALDPATGKGEIIWRHAGPRNEVAHLSIADVDRDGKPELAVTYYESKYMVTTHHIEADGTAKAAETPIRMASSWAFGDIDGDGTTDRAIGRVYGDAKGEPGDLKIDLGKGLQKVPTDKGVRSVVVAQLFGDAHPYLYFADGWVANYGKEAKAQLKRAWVEKGEIKVEAVTRSPEEFTFFEIDDIELAGNKRVLFARGNKAVSAVSPGSEGFGRVQLATLQPVLNAALGQDAQGQWQVYVPNAQGLRVIPAKL